MPLILEPPLPASDLQGRLGQLQRRIRSIVVIAGGAGLLAVMLAFISIVALTDLLLDWPAPFRALFLFGGFIGTAWMIRRWIVIPWRQAGDQLTLARRVEAATPGVDEALASAVEFSRLENDPLAGSLQLRHATAFYAARRTRTFDFTEAADARWLFI